MKGTTTNLLPLNVKAIKSAKARDGKPTEYRVKGSRGLVLIVQASGKASWFCFYHTRQGSKRRLRKYWLGSRDVTNLAEAREGAAKIMRAAEKGQDPVGEVEARRGALTLRNLFEQRLSLDRDTAARTLEDYRKALELDVFPRIGDVPAVDLTSDQIADVLERIERRSRHSAHRARCAIGSTYRWAVRRSKLRRNPVVGLGFTVRPVPRERVLSDDEWYKLCRGIETAPGMAEPMRIIFKLVILTGLRESEVAGGRANEIRLDGPLPRWTITRTVSRAGQKVEGRMKRKRRDHLLPLTPQVVALLRRALELNCGSEFLFPADLTRTRNGRMPRKPHINGESVSRAMARLREEIQLKDVRVHDFRKCITTWLAERGFRREVRKHIMHHGPQDVTDAHYDFSTLEGPVRSALQAWADHVCALARGREQPPVAASADPVLATIEDESKIVALVSDGGSSAPTEPANLQGNPLIERSSVVGS
jgi:integrase